VEKEIGFEMGAMTDINLALHNPDFTTSKRISARINGFTKEQTAFPKDPSTVSLRVPQSYAGRAMEFITQIEQLTVQPDQAAKVVIDEQNGIIVMGEKVRISTVAISHGNLTIKITETPQVSQPNPFSNTGTTTTVDRTGISINENADKKMTVLKPHVTLQSLVEGLNALGVGPRDMITILQNIKKAGALQADLEMK
jgi:flagellar P-ring protein precursor FlgI